MPAQNADKKTTYCERIADGLKILATLNPKVPRIDGETVYIQVSRFNQIPESKLDKLMELGFRLTNKCEFATRFAEIGDWNESLHIVKSQLGRAEQKLRDADLDAKTLRDKLAQERERSVNFGRKLREASLQLAHMKARIERLEALNRQLTRESAGECDAA